MAFGTGLIAAENQSPCQTLVACLGYTSLSLAACALEMVPSTCFRAWPVGCIGGPWEVGRASHQVSAFRLPMQLALSSI